jgi:hypothetical protein
VLAALEREQPVPGARVIALAHHVDYWDALGWADPFGSARATARQRDYRFSSGTYTPQAVIDGLSDTIGSRRSELEAAVAAAARMPHVPVSIAIESRSTRRVVVTASTTAAGAETWIALTQSRASVAVPRGENRGRVLQHTAIVRLMQRGPRAIFELPPGAWGCTAPCTLDVRAFAQDPRSHRVLGSATAPLPAVHAGD